MTRNKSADQNLTEELIHKEGRGKWGKFEESKNVVDDDGGCNGPTIKHTSYFEEVGELYIAGEDYLKMLLSTGQIRSFKG